MSTMTKDQLREALVAHGVDAPPLSTRKRELIALYRTHVSDLGLFSSDDEDEDSREADTSKTPKTASPRKSPVKKASRSASSLMAGEDLEQLTDDQLFARLRERGIQAGPIVATTRKFYLKKLASLLHEPDANKSVSNGRSPKLANDLDQYSAEEEEMQPEVSVTKSSRNSTLKSPSTALRQRLPESFADSRERFTPTPRRSIHSYKVTESSKESLMRSPEGLTTRNYTYEKKTFDSDKDSAGNRVVRWLPKIFMLIIFIVVVYFTIKDHGDKFSKLYLQLIAGNKPHPRMVEQQGEGTYPLPRENLDEQPSIGNV